MRACSDSVCGRTAVETGETPGWLAFPVSMLRRDFDSFCDKELGAIGLKRGQLHFILFIGRRPGCTQRDLTSLFGIDAGHSTRYIARLAAEGFIEQRRNERDERSHTLFLTKRGIEAYERSKQILDRWDALATAGLSEKERVQLKSLLNRVLAERTGWAAGIGPASNFPTAR